MNNLYLSRKEEIVLTTIELINELGIKEVSIKEIAKREGVTEASLYKHFKGKEEIIISVIDYYEKFDNHIYETLHVGGLSSKEVIEFYFNIYAEYYSNYKEITSLIGACSVWQYDDKYVEKVMQIVQKKIIFLKEVIQSGQKKGEFRENILAENMVYLFLGGFEKIIEMWRMRKYEFELKQKVQEIVVEVLEICETKKRE